MAEGYITFEQPVNDHIRVCLRLEHLFQLITHNISSHSTSSHRIAIESMLGALNVIDRPDLKSKLTKALSTHASHLSVLEKSSKVDSQKLRLILSELDQLIDSLYGSHDKIAHQLRQNPFLATIRQHMGNPGGACPFSTPAYHIWLNLPAEQRIEQLNQWVNEFGQLKKAMQLLLQLTRGSKTMGEVLAENGFYQENLDASAPVELIRIAIPLRVLTYPEISVGRHRLSVRFIDFNLSERASTKQANFTFKLACCGQ